MKIDQPESLGQFLTWRAPRIRTIVGSNILIPQGKLILCGAYKSWKSMTAMDLAFCISQGRPWFGFTTTQSNVLVVQLEIPKAAYQDRVIKYFKHHEGQPIDNLFFLSTRLLKLDKGWGKNLLKQWIDMTQAQIVVIDPIYKTVSGHLIDEYDVGLFTDAIDEIIEEKKVTFILVHHEGKGTYVEGEKLDRGADASYGSAKFGWWVDTQIGLKTQMQGGNVIDISFPLLRLAVNDIPSFTYEVSRETLEFRMKLPDLEGGIE